MYWSRTNKMVTLLGSIESERWFNTITRKACVKFVISSKVMLKFPTSQWYFIQDSSSFNRWRKIVLTLVIPSSVNSTEELCFQRVVVVKSRMNKHGLFFVFRDCKSIRVVWWSVFLLPLKVWFIFFQVKNLVLFLIFMSDDSISVPLYPSWFHV